MQSMYRLRCLGCGASYADDGIMVRCLENHPPAFLRSEYRRTRLTADAAAHGIMRYRDWLPVQSGTHYDVSRTPLFQSEALNRRLGTPNLWLAFNGYWPARGALLPTGTFKDLETAAVLARFPRERTLVAASAGNTAAALAHACSTHHVRAIIVVPERALESICKRVDPQPCVQIVALGNGASYDEAIAHARELASSDPVSIFEGGAGNVARRDGIGTTMLAATETLGSLPEYFVQAIGSGAGAIAAHEAALRLRADGRFGQEFPRLLLVQNAPSAPVYESWQRRSRTLISYGDDVVAQRERVASLWAPVLGMQAPPYAITGGLFDVLSESNGEVCVADNAQAQAAATLFAQLEGVRIDPASAVGLAGLQAVLESDRIAREARIVLHVTGGDVRRQGTVSAA
jgi:cysteate synthase